MAISRERMVVEIRDWCQNVGEYNTYNFYIWHFALCVIVSKIERCRRSDPPYEIAINPWWCGGRGLPSLIALFAMYVLEIMSTNCDKCSHHMIISCTMIVRGASFGACSLDSYMYLLATMALVFNILCLPFFIGMCPCAHIHHNSIGGNGNRESVFVHMC